MTVVWELGRPFVTFTGDNAQEIADEMSDYLAQSQAKVDNPLVSKVVLNPEHSGKSLSLSQMWPDHTDGETGEPVIVHDRWRVPVGYRIDVRGGEVQDSNGVPQDWNDLVQMD
jgi:hypothetical protein